MKKLPHIPFYTGDWMKDPAVSLCTPATRGVWIDLLCAMHELGRLGELRGTTEQIARLARCSTAELIQALTELQTTGAAEVQERNSSWVIANRRMKREAATREKRAVAGSKGGSQAQASREQVPDYDTDNEGLRKVREFCKEIGVREADADFLFWKWHGNGWTNNGEPIRDWKATIRAWQRAGYLPSQKARNGSTPQGVAPVQKQDVPDAFKTWLLVEYPDKREQIAGWKTTDQIPTGLRGDWQKWRKERVEAGVPKE